MTTKEFLCPSLLFLLGISLWGGCSRSNTTIPTQIPDVTIQSSTPVRTDSDETIISTIPSQTISPTNNTVLPIPTETQHTPSPVPHSTLTIDQEKELLQRFLFDNGGCQLPCLWGITPGLTGLDTVNDLLLPFNDVSIPSDFYVHKRVREGSGGVSFIMWKENISVPITLSYYNEQDNIEFVSLTFEAGIEEGEGVDLSIKPGYGEPFYGQTLGYFRLSNILTEYGVPDEVLIAPFPDDPQYPPDTALPFSIVLIYHEQGMFLEYILPKELNPGNYYVGCPTKSGYLSVIVWDPKQNISIEEIAPKTSGVGINSQNVDYFQPLENVSTMTPNDFHQIFKDSINTTCIETPEEIWR